MGCPPPLTSALYAVHARPQLVCPPLVSAVCALRRDSILLSIILLLVRDLLMQGLVVQVTVITVALLCAWYFFRPMPADERVVASAALSRTLSRLGYSPALAASTAREPVVPPFSLDEARPGAGGATAAGTSGGPGAATSAGGAARVGGMASPRPPTRPGFEGLATPASTGPPAASGPQVFPSLRFELGSREYALVSGKLWMSRRKGAFVPRLSHLAPMERTGVQGAASEVDYDHINADLPLVVGAVHAVQLAQTRHIFYRAADGHIIAMSRTISHWRAVDVFDLLRMDDEVDVALCEPICSVSPSSIHIFYVSPEGHVHELYFNSAFGRKWKHTILTLGQSKKYLVGIDRGSLVPLPHYATGEGSSATGPGSALAGSGLGGVGPQAGSGSGLGGVGPQAGSGGSSRCRPCSGAPVPLLPQPLEFDGKDGCCLRYTTVSGRRCRLYRRGLGGLFGWRFAVM